MPPIEKTHILKNFICLFVTLEHKSSHTKNRYICSNRQQNIVWVKIINVYFMPISLGYKAKIMFHEDILSISNRKYIKT